MTINVKKLITLLTDHNEAQGGKPEEHDVLYNWYYGVLYGYSLAHQDTINDVAFLADINAWISTWRS